jgi:hypothetical protein
MTCAQTCKQKYFWEFVAEHPEGGQGLVPLEAKLAPTKGTLMHAGLQKFYELKLHQPTTPYADRVVLAIKHAIDSIKNFRLDENLVPLLKEELISALDQYCQKYEVDDLEPIAVELPVKVQAGDYIHTGIVDLVAKWHGVVYIVDHKTTSMQLTHLFKKLRFDLSLKGYAIALSQQRNEVVHSLVNGIRFKGTKTLECEFDREPIHYSESEVAEFVPTIQSIRREIEDCERTGFWPKAGAQCVQLWGECDYRKLCLYQDQAMIKTFYQPRKPKPKEGT